ncbi:helix-turn-helix transcriptional regulator [Streptomyces albus]
MKTTPPPPGLVYAKDSEGKDGERILGIASRLGISYSTYLKWRMTGKGPATFKLGKNIAAREEAVEAYIAEQERAAQEPSIDARPPEPRRFTPRKSRKPAVEADAELAATA